MPAQQRQAAPAAGQIDSKLDEGPDVQNPPPAAQSPATSQSSDGYYRVLTGVLTLSEDKEGKKVVRVLRGQKIKPGDHVDVEHLLALRAIEPWGTKAASIGFSTAMHLSRAANAAAEEYEPEYLEDGSSEPLSGEDEAE